MQQRAAVKGPPKLYAAAVGTVVYFPKGKRIQGGRRTERDGADLLPAGEGAAARRTDGEARGDGRGGVETERAVVLTVVFKSVLAGELNIFE